MSRRLTALLAAAALVLGPALAARADSSTKLPEPPKAPATATPAPDLSRPASSDANPPAAAQSLADIRHQGALQIIHRLASLHQLTGRIRGDRTVTPADQKALNDIYGADAAGLVALAHDLNRATTAGAATADFEDIFTGYRIYALVVPQTYLVVNADRLGSYGAALGAVADRTAAAVSAAQAGGADVTQALADLGAARAAVTGAASTLSGFSAPVSGDASTAGGSGGGSGAPVTGTASTASGLSGVVLALTPAGFPDNAGVLKAAAGAEATARDQLLTARALLVKVRNELLGAARGKGGDHGNGASHSGGGHSDTAPGGPSPDHRSGSGGGGGPGGGGPGGGAAGGGGPGSGGPGGGGRGGHH